MTSNRPRSSNRHHTLPADPLELIEAGLRGGDAYYPPDPAPGFAEQLLELSALHGVDGLLDSALGKSEASQSWPLDLRDRLRKIARSQAVRELLIKRELDVLLPKLADAQVEFLLLKGTPLAYSIYPQPYLRSRGDTDLLVPPAKRQATERVLLDAGYRAGESAGGSLASYELSYSKTDSAGVEHVLDLHWRISNSQIYARMLRFDELFGAAVTVPKLGPAARMPCPVLALLIACLHRISHLHAPYYVGGVPHLEANRLIWLWDIHLLVGGLSPAEWEDFVTFATRKGVRAICLDGIHVTRRAFHTAVPQWVLNRLAAPGPAELSAGYLTPGRWRHQLLELRALESWGQRLRLAREWVFPPADYVLRKYQRQNRLLLPWLYLRRAFGGIVARIR
jgi:hypothetical protein